MASYRGLKVPQSMLTQMKNVVVKKSIDLTSFLDRGSVADDVVNEDAGVGWRKNETGRGISANGKTTSMGSITDNQIIEDHDFGDIKVAVSTSNTKSWGQRRRENRAIARVRGANS
jgi:hypothetical protein